MRECFLAVAAEYRSSMAASESGLNPSPWMVMCYIDGVIRSLEQGEYSNAVSICKFFTKHVSLALHPDHYGDDPTEDLPAALIRLHNGVFHDYFKSDTRSVARLPYEMQLIRHFLIRGEDFAHADRLRNCLLECLDGQLFSFLAGDLKKLGLDDGASFVSRTAMSMLSHPRARAVIWDAGWMDLAEKDPAFVDTFQFAFNPRLGTSYVRQITNSYNFDESSFDDSVLHQHNVFPTRAFKRSYREEQFQKGKFSWLVKRWLANSKPMNRADARVQQWVKRFDINTQAAALVGEFFVAKLPILFLAPTTVVLWCLICLPALPGLLQMIAGPVTPLIDLVALLSLLCALSLYALVYFLLKSSFKVFVGLLKTIFLMSAILVAEVVGFLSRAPGPALLSLLPAMTMAYVCYVALGLPLLSTLLFGAGLFVGLTFVRGLNDHSPKRMQQIRMYGGTNMLIVYVATAGAYVVLHQLGWDVGMLSALRGLAGAYTAPVAMGALVMALVFTTVLTLTLAWHVRGFNSGSDFGGLRSKGAGEPASRFRPAEEVPLSRPQSDTNAGTSEAGHSDDFFPSDGLARERCGGVGLD